jgi:hypothetical protein
MVVLSDSNDGSRAKTRRSRPGRWRSHSRMKCFLPPAKTSEPMLLATAQQCNSASFCTVEMVQLPGNMACE